MDLRKQTVGLSLGESRGQRNKIFEEIARVARRLHESGDYSAQEIADDCVSRFAGRYDETTVRSVVAWTVS